MYIMSTATGEAHSREPGERPSQLLILLSVGRGERRGGSGSVDAGAYRRCPISHAQLWVYIIQYNIIRGRAYSFCRNSRQRDESE